MTFRPNAVLRAALVVSALLSGAGFAVINTAAAEAVASGPASWYGGKFHGRQTANGERFDQNGLTAAHRTLPFGTKVRVTNRKNGKSVVVRINDRGPFHGNRVIDLSRGAAQAVGLINSGVAPVSLQVLGSSS
jgi:rare lipoprotein A